jgi:hypothetical protein
MAQRRSRSWWMAAGLGCWVLFGPSSARAFVCTQDGGCPDVPCDTAADCGDDFLVCVPKTVYVCTDPCDGSTPAVLNLCEVRYQLPCQIDSDCGAGFTCVEDAEAVCSLIAGNCTHYSRCRSQYTLCASDGECPKGWSCYSPGPATCGPSGCDRDAGPPKACYPPFAIFNGGGVTLPPGPLPADAGATHGDAVAGSNSSTSAANPSDASAPSVQEAKTASDAETDAARAPSETGSNAPNNASGCACATQAAPIESLDVSVMALIGLALVRRRWRTRNVL